MERSQLRHVLDVGMTVAMIGLIGLLGWRLLRAPSPLPAPPKVEVPAEPVSLVGAHFKGDQSAPWTLLLFDDFACSACRMFEREAMPTLLRDYVDPGRLRLAVHTIPLQAPGLAAASEVALSKCAAERGKFWLFREAMFARPSPDAEDTATVLSRVLGPESDPCPATAQDDGRRLVELAQRAGLQGTPYFLLGRVSGEALQAVTARRGIGKGDGWLSTWLDDHVR